MSNRRLLQPEEIPSSLWSSGTNTLTLPLSVSQAYRTVLEREHLLERALSDVRTGGAIGGEAAEAAEEHFALRYDGSLARTQLALLDPLQQLVGVCDGLVATLAGGDVCLVDAPAGALATAISLLTTVAELRKCNVMPRRPLTVHVLAADRSRRAAELAAEMLGEVEDTLRSQAIFVSLQPLEWDVMDAVSNTRLIQSMLLASPEPCFRLIALANFSGFLSSGTNFTKAKGQIEELLRHASTRESMALWIEPSTNQVTNAGGLFGRVVDLARDMWWRFARLFLHAGTNAPLGQCACSVQSPLRERRVFTVHLTVMAFNLNSA